MKQETKIVELDIKDLLPIAVVLGVTGIVIAYTLQVQGDVQTNMVEGDCLTNSSQCSAEYNATGQSIEGSATLAARLPLVATVLGAALVIGILIRNLAMN